MIAIITGTISPSQKMDQLALRNSDERLEQYINSLCFFLKSGAFSGIVFCENSNYDLTKLSNVKKTAEREKVELELLSFQGNTEETVSHGKGYGEGEIMDYVFAHSDLVRSERYFMKITGRLKVDNMKDITAHMIEGKTYFNIPNRTRRDFYDTRIYAMSTEQFRTKFRNQYYAVRDHEGVFLEHVYTEILKKENISVLNFPRYPRIVGTSGSMGMSYGYTEWKCRIKDLLSRFNYYQIN